MSVHEISAEGWMWAVVVVLALISVYNTLMTARKHARDEKLLKDSPTAILERRVDEHDKWLENDKRRLDELEHRLDDYQHGMMANCHGMLSLIEYQARHSAPEERDALDGAGEEIKKWLTERTRR